MDIRDKIAKLLALSASPNEHEAKAAMLKARELMALYKLTQAELEKKPDVKVIRYKTDITCSRRRNAWTVDLAAVIARNYCCLSYMIRAKGKQTVTVALTGYEEDVMICHDVIKYALECIQSWAERTRRLCSELYTPDDMRGICDSYARGFVRGVDAAYNLQAGEHADWGLVLAPPPEANMLLDTLKKVNFHGSSSNVPNLFNQGFQDGAAFKHAKETPGHAVLPM